MNKNMDAEKWKMMNIKFRGLWRMIAEMKKVFKINYVILSYRNHSTEVNILKKHYQETVVKAPEFWSR